MDEDFTPLPGYSSNDVSDLLERVLSQGGGGGWFKRPYHLVLLGIYMGGGFPLNNHAGFIVDDNEKQIHLTESDLVVFNSELRRQIRNDTKHYYDECENPGRYDDFEFNPSRSAEITDATVNVLIDNRFGEYMNLLYFRFLQIISDRIETFRALIASKARNDGTITVGDTVVHLSADELKANEEFNGFAAALTNALSSKVSTIQSAINDITVDVRSKESSIQEQIDGITVSTDAKQREINKAISDITCDIDVKQKEINDAIAAIDCDTAEKQGEINSIIKAITCDTNEKQASINRAISGITHDTTVKQSEINAAIAALSAATDSVHAKIKDENWVAHVIAQIDSSMKVYLDSKYTDWLRTLVTETERSLVEIATQSKDLDQKDHVMEGYLISFSEAINKASDITSIYTALRDILSQFYDRVQDSEDLISIMNKQYERFNTLNDNVANNLEKIQDTLDKGNQITDVRDVTMAVCSIITALASISSNRLTAQTIQAKIADQF